MWTIAEEENDRKLRDAVLRQLAWAPEIDVSSKDGAVTLEGCIYSYALKIAAEEAAKSVYGVKALSSDIKLVASR
jgi:osmotically-inducible protein OsmY